MSLRQIFLSLQSPGDGGCEDLLTDSVFSSIASHGAPIFADDSTVVFLYVGDAQQISIAGDFNGWSPLSDTLQKAGRNPLHYLQRTVPLKGRIEYKFVVDSRWVLDPLNPSRVMGGFGENSEVRMPGYVPPLEAIRQDGMACGRIDTIAVTSSVLGCSHVIYVYSPGSGNRRGSSLPVILVTFLTRELLPTIRKSYPIPQSPDSIAISGASMGGLIATYAAFTRPDIFGMCAAQSPSYWWGHDSLITMMSLGKREKIRFYLDTGQSMTHKRKLG